MNKIVTIDPSTQDEIVPKHNLLGLSYPQLVAFFADIGEKAFRASQVMKWIHQYGVTDFTQMTNLSKKLQDKLTQVATVTPLSLIHI